MNITKEQIVASLRIATAVASAIKEAGPNGLPSGPLYATICGKISYMDYMSLLDTLKNADLIKQDNNVLYWKGPA